MRRRSSGKNGVTFLHMFLCGKWERALKQAQGQSRPCNNGAAGMAGSGRCRSFPDCLGWGCRLLTIAPSEPPRTDKDRARLFAAVYREAERLGVLDCPDFDELRIDRAVDSDRALADILRASKSHSSGDYPLHTRCYQTLIPQTTDK